MDNIYKAVQLTIDSDNLALTKTPTHIYIANQYVDTNDTPLITAPFIIQKALENGTGVVDIVSSTIGSIYEVRLLCDAEVLISGYFYMPPMNAKFSELELYTSYPPRTPPVINEFWQKTENFILEKTNTLLNFVQVFNSLSSMRLSLGYLEELLTTKKSNLVSAINEVLNKTKEQFDIVEEDISGINELLGDVKENGWTDVLIETLENVNQRQINDGLESIAQLLSIKKPRDGMRVYVKSYHAGYNRGGGWFVYDSTKVSVNDGGNVINGWVRQVTPAYLNPYNFGALGDGTQNDWDNIAFDAISQYVKNTPYKGYAIDIEHGEYCVISQKFVAGQGYQTTSALNIKFESMTDKSIIVKSDNAKLKLRDGLRYGYFDPNTGNAVANGDGYAENYAANVGWIFSFCNIKKLVISGRVELDGNSSKANIGGRYSSGGFDTWAYGLWVVRVEDIYIENVNSHDHLTDGVYICGCSYDGTAYRGASESASDRSKVDWINPNWHGVINNVTSTRNGRQCLSVTGGQNLTFNDCYFDKAGTDDLPLQSMPKTTLDIETDISSVRNLTFNKCFFGDAAYPVACGNNIFGWDIRKVTFNDCKFVNNVSYMTVSVAVPEVTFNQCLLSGSIAYSGFYSQIESERTKFNNCTITDNSKYRSNTLTTTLYRNNDKFNPIFRNCVFGFYNNSLMTWHVDAAIVSPRLTFDDCIFNMFSDSSFADLTLAGVGLVRVRDLRQTKSAQDFRNDVFRGVLVFEGDSSSISLANPANNPNPAKVVRNAEYNLPYIPQIPTATVTYDPPSLATATQQSTTVALTGAKMGDAVTVSFSNPLQGTRMWGEVTATNTVTVYHRNDTGAAVDLASGTLTVKIV